ncbi:hypothetical protein Dimus_014540 [Dionaea muscipula]
MGRGVSCGGGQSSLGYLFGSGETTNNGTGTTARPTLDDSKPITSSPPPQLTDCERAAGTPGNLANNYIRAEGQNRGNFITDRPTTKVHAAPGGSSSLGYLFGGSGN